MTRPVLLIDNLDSFTFNLVESLKRLGHPTRVVRNCIDAGEALMMADASGAAILLSPGPGSPEDAGCCLELIARAKGKIPVIGICLGHQAIVQEAGGRVGRADSPVHGKASVLPHDGRGPFTGLPNPLAVGRYHSLATRNLPDRFSIHATIGDMAMAFTDPVARQAGLQFHPESILTTHGDAMLSNLLC